MLDELPDGLVKYGQTPTFDAATTPSKLLNTHTTKRGTWGRIVMVEGRLLYRILEPTPREVELNPECFGIIEPEIRHKVEILGDVKFYVEFYRIDSE